MIKIASNVKISKLADIEDSTRGSTISIGENSMIDAFVKFKAAGGNGDITIGKNCYINSGSVLYIGNGINIGNDVLIAANCTLAPVNHAISDKKTPIRKQGFSRSKGGITIEDDVWIGAGSVLLDGAYLSKGCVIAANSTVEGKIEAYSINKGSPLTCIGYRK